VSKVRQILSVAALIAPLVLAACGDHDVEVRKSAGADNVKFVGRDSNRVIGPNDIQISSADTAVELAIVGDTIVAGLGKTVRDKVSQKTDTNAVSGNGFAAGIEKMVKSSVANAMNHEVLIPVSEISDVRYEDGGLRFYGKDGGKMHVFENSHNGKEGTSAFNEADAQRFIAVFKARKAHTG
jgi:hypothetical protein